MEKYRYITLSEAFQVLVLRKSASDCAYGKMLEEEANQPGDVKVTITVPTHRISTPYKADDILALKNQVEKASKQLMQLLGKGDSAAIIKSIKTMQDLIDYSHNRESLVLYANKKLAFVVKLPISLKPEIVIGEYFNVCPLIKAKEQFENYYIVAISRRKIRLIQAFNDSLIQEIKNEDFPFVNTYYTDKPIELAQDVFVDNLRKEFFNIADKRLQIYLKENPLPVVLLGDVKNIADFREQMDDSRPVILTRHGNYDDMPAHEIIRKVVFPLIRDYVADKDNQYLLAIEDAQSKDLLTLDFNQLYNSIVSANVDTLYLGNNFTFNGSLHDGVIEVDPATPRYDSQKIFLELLEKTRNSGGKIIFLDDDLMRKYDGIALVRKY